MSVKESGAEMLTVEQVAGRLRLSVSKVYELLEAGEIPHYKFGRSKRVSEQDLDAYLSRCRVGAREKHSPAPRPRLGDLKF